MDRFVENLNRPRPEEADNLERMRGAYHRGIADLERNVAARQGLLQEAKTSLTAAAMEYANAVRALGEVARRLDGMRDDLEAIERDLAALAAKPSHSG